MQRPGRQDGPGGAGVPGLQLDVRVRKNNRRLPTHRGRCDVLPRFGYGANDSEACYIDSRDCTLQRPLLAAVFCNDFAGPVKALVVHWPGLPVLLSRCKAPLCFACKNCKTTTSSGEIVLPGASS